MESMAAPARDNATAPNVVHDFFSLKNSIMPKATAKGYMKCIMEAAPLEIFL